MIGCGPVRYARVFRNKDGRSKGFGLVQYEHEADAEKALKTMDNVLLAGRNIGVHEHVVGEKAQERKAMLHETKARIHTPQSQPQQQLTPDQRDNHSSLDSSASPVRPKGDHSPVEERNDTLHESNLSHTHAPRPQQQLISDHDDHQRVCHSPPARSASPTRRQRNYSPDRDRKDSFNESKTRMHTPQSQQEQLIPKHENKQTSTRAISPVHQQRNCSPVRESSSHSLTEDDSYLSLSRRELQERIVNIKDKISMLQETLGKYESRLALFDAREKELDEINRELERKRQEMEEINREIERKRRLRCSSSDSEEGSRWRRRNSYSPRDTRRTL